MSTRIIECSVMEIPDEDYREEDMFWIYFPDYRAFCSN